MKRLIITIFSLFVLNANLAVAGFYNGNDLNKLREGYIAYEKRGSANPIDYQRSAGYMGYVAGVADMGNTIYFCFPNGVTLGQLAAVVSKYMDENPDKWAMDAHILVITALATAFLCRK